MLIDVGSVGTLLCLVILSSPCGQKVINGLVHMLRSWLEKTPTVNSLQKVFSVLEFCSVNLREGLLVGASVPFPPRPELFPTL